MAEIAARSSKGGSEVKDFTISPSQRRNLGRLYLTLRAAGEELQETFRFFEPSEVEGEQRRQRVRQLTFQLRNRRKALAAFNRFFENHEPEWVRRAKRLAPRAARQFRESETRRLFRRRT
jgi:hypothetical protein